MASVNLVVIAGNLTRDVEVRNLPSGQAVADLSLAISERFKDKTGAQQETVCYVEVVAWGKTAENCGQYLRKGSPVLVEGRLQLDQWEKDGQKRSKLRVRADRVHFLGQPSGERTAPQAQRTQASPTTPPPPDDDIPF